MSGKENFKAVMNSHLDNIMTEYGVDNDTAYQTLAEALDNPMVLNALSKVIADICKEEEEKPKTTVNPWESWVDSFLKRANGIQ